MSDVKEDFAKTLKECEECKDNVEAYIVLVVTDKDTEDGKYGINSMSGSRFNLCNLYLNINKEIAKEAYFMGALTKIAEGLFKDD